MSDSNIGNLTEQDMSALLPEERQRSCVMSDPKTGDIIQIFKSCSQAERITGISRSIIGEACNKDGGQIDQFCFRFISVDSTQPSTNSIRVPTANEKGSTMMPNSNVSRSSNVEAGCNDDETKLKRMIVDGEIMRDIEPAMEHLTGDSRQHPIEKDNKLEEKINPQLQRQQIQDQPPKLQHPSSHGSFDPPTKLHFDILTLQALKSKASLKKKVVQLHCKGSSGKILVCFQGSSDAANALGIKRKVVTSMCEQSSTGKEGEGAQRFDTYSLSYASNRSSPNVYLYGTHKEDWTKLPPLQNSLGGRDDYEGSRETYDGRLERWKETFSKERNLEVKIDSNHRNDDVPPNSPAIASTISKNTLPPNLQQQHSNSSTGYHPTSLRTGANTKMPLQTQSLMKEENGGMCVVCQESRADVVFEPCQHCVVCAKCFQKGLCTKFCPSCCLKVHSTNQSSFLNLIRPRIYLAHFFM